MLNKRMSDSDLLAQVKALVQSERNLVTKLLHHLREVERRRLYSDLGYASLFDYAVRELKYSESQASRRIAAMRLLAEVPELEAKITSGALSLSNASQVQTFFRNIKSQKPESVIAMSEKLAVIARIENKSSREAQRELFSLQPNASLPKEREKFISDQHTELRFVITEELKSKLEEVRTLLGAKGASMTYAELVEAMSEISLQALKEKRFGKRRVQEKEVEEKSEIKSSEAPPARNPRHIPRRVQYQVWQRDKGKCVGCGSGKYVHYDHIQPVALGGRPDLDNLRLLCFHCNQRAGIKVFGINAMEI